MLDVIIFNVEHGQSIFFYPRNDPTHGMFVDCGNTEIFNPIDYLINLGLVPKNASGRHQIGQLVITNYDHDHFSGLPYLLSKAHVSSVRLAENLSSQELVAMKEENTDALKKVCHLKDTYIYPNTSNPPYTVTTHTLTKDCFSDGECDTNNLSQVVFVAYGGSVICISGDVEGPAWEQLLARPGFQASLRATDIFVAAHHGRESGYAEEVFSHCSPEVVVLSDKRMVHGTQEGMTTTYANHVSGNGVRLTQPRTLTPRKVLTTRNDGHIWVRLDANNSREYKTL